MNAPIINIEDRGLILLIAKEIFTAMSHSSAGVRQIGDYHFDRNFRPEIVPTWGRNPDTLTGCLLEMNGLSEREATIYTELGSIVSSRLRDKAHKWFWSLLFDYRRDA